MVNPRLILIEYREIVENMERVKMEGWMNDSGNDLEGGLVVLLVDLLTGLGIKI